MAKDTKQAAAETVKSDDRKILGNYYLGGRTFHADAKDMKGECDALAKTASKNQLRELLAAGVIEGDWNTK